MAANCSTLDLLDADDDVANDAVECRNDDHLLDPAHNESAGGDDGELQRMGGRCRPSTAREIFVVQGEPTGTSRPRSLSSKKVIRPRPGSATLRRSETRHEVGNQQSAAAADSDLGSSISRRDRQNQYESQLHALREQLEQVHRELAHTREEREELHVAFRRLDQEITNGYNLTERKEKEMKIAELLAKNLKLSQMLEKELKSQEVLKAANNDLQAKVAELEGQTTLLNHVLASVETKHAALAEAHSQLIRTHLAAQESIVELQAQILQWEAKGGRLTNGTTFDYEEKLKLFESRCSELQRKLDDKSTLLRAEQDKNCALEQSCEKLLEEKADLEAEVASVHDKMIRMNGAIKTMEAAVEASSNNAHEVSLLSRMKERIRVLEEEMLGKNRLIIDLKESVNSLLNGSTVGQSQRSLKRRHPSVKVAHMRSEPVSSRIIALTQRLRKAEEARDHKSRCLNVLLAMLPQLLQQLDALQDKFHATLESNTILSHAIEQLQSGDQGSRLQNEPVIALAREGYLLSGPYQPELLMGFTLSKALSEVAPPPPKKQANLMPFHVRTRVNISDNSSSQGELVLAADADDSSGVAFLNRSKINAFLHFVQGSAAKAKSKHLLVQKIADLLSTQREMMRTYSCESSYYKASIAKLEAEVRQRAKQHIEMQNELERCQSTSRGGQEPTSSRRIKLLLKLIETIADTPQQRNHTFLTQAEGGYGSDVLIEGADTGGESHLRHVRLTLDLSGCGIQDEDLEPVLLKISVGSYPIFELDLCDNEIGDNGAASIAAFLETCPRSIKVVNLRGNTRITSDGITRMRNGAMKCPGACRVEIDSARNAIVVVAVDHEFDTSGRPTPILQVLLPEQPHHGGSAGEAPTQDESVQQMIHKLESLGFSDTSANWARAEAVYRPASKASSALKGSVRHAASRASSSGRAAGRALQSAPHDKKLRALEAALQRAEGHAPVASTAKRRGVSLAQMQHLLKSHTSTTTISSQRWAKLQFAQSHLATIRGLGGR